MRCTNNRTDKKNNSNVRRDKGRKVSKQESVKRKAEYERRNAHRRKKLKRKRRIRFTILSILYVALFVMIALSAAFLINREKKEVLLFEEKNYKQEVLKDNLFAEKLCVTNDDTFLEGYERNDSLYSVGLFDLENLETLHSENIHVKIYPASTTKLMTAYLALKYGNLDDMVTVKVKSSDFHIDEQVCGLNEGDTLSLYDLVCGLMLYSGNDAAVAIAEHISGSVEEFVKLMNEEALLLGASNSHFMNPHGLHEEDHYVTAYDLYLIFTECMKNPDFVKIISEKNHVATITDKDGNVFTPGWYATNYYATGDAQAPQGVHVIGGKTGTTDEARSCVILYSETDNGKKFISVVMGAPDKEVLYSEMTKLLDAGVAQK